MQDCEIKRQVLDMPVSKYILEWIKCITFCKSATYSVYGLSTPIHSFVGNFIIIIIIIIIIYYYLLLLLFFIFFLANGFKIDS